MIKRPLRLLCTLIALGLTASCYLPNKFELTMQIAPDGRYAAAYEGTLTQLQFLARLGSKDIVGDQVDEYVTIYENEIRRNTGFKEVSYIGNAEYRVKFETQGSIAREKQFSFPSRKGTILGLRRWTADMAEDKMARYRAMRHPAMASLAAANFANEPHILEIFGDKLPQKIREDLKANGFWVRGRIRIWTSAKVGYHNAQQVVEGNPSLYIWDVVDMEGEPPEMVIAWTPPSS